MDGRALRASQLQAFVRRDTVHQKELLKDAMLQQRALQSAELQPISLRCALATLRDRRAQAQRGVEGYAAPAQLMRAAGTVSTRMSLFTITICGQGRTRATSVHAAKASSAAVHCWLYSTAGAVEQSGG